MNSHKYGPWAVVAGGSEGIGAEIGNRLAAEGVNICLVARNEAALGQQAQHLRDTYDVQTVHAAVDLAQPDGVDQVKEMAEPHEVGFYAHVASYAPLSPYLETDEERHRRALNVNVISAHELTWHFTMGMRERGHGGVLLCSSMASLSPFPNNAQYAADKAYLRILGEGLWFELRDHGIDVLTAVISEVATPAFVRSGSKLQGGKRTLEPIQVVDEAFERIGRTPSFVTGGRNRLLAMIGQHLVPKKTMMSILAKQIGNYKEAVDEH